MKFKVCVSDVKELDSEERTIIAYGSKPVVDRDKEVIDSRAWKLDSFKKNPVLMLSHNYSLPPIGKVLWVKTDKNGLKFKAQFAKTQVAEEVYQLYKEGVMRAFSVGFIPKKWVDEEKEADAGYGRGVRTFTEVELLEISCVSVPCCPEALIEDVKQGKTDKVKTKALKEVIMGLEGKKEDGEVEDLICPECGEKKEELDDETGLCEDCIVKLLKEEQEDKELKGAIPYANHGKADEGTAWDAGKEVKAADINDLQVMCAWKADKPKDELTKGDFKLPHHRQSDKKAVWNGVRAAMGALMGARGGVNIPDSDKRGVYNHLAKHYKEFDKEVPPFKEYTDEELEKIFGIEQKNIKNNSEKIVYIKCKECGEFFDVKLSEIETADELCLKCKEVNDLSVEEEVKLIVQEIKDIKETLGEFRKLIDGKEKEKGDEIELDFDLKEYLEEKKKKEEVNIDELKGVIEETLSTFMESKNDYIAEVIDERLKKLRGKVS